MKAWLATVLLLLILHPGLQADIALPQAQDRRIDTSGPGIYQFVQLMNADDFPEFHFSLLCGGNQNAEPISYMEVISSGRIVSIGNEGRSYRMLGMRGNERYFSDEIPLKMEYADLTVIRYRLHRVKIVQMRDGKLSLEIDSHALMDSQGREVQGTVRGSLSPIGWLGSLALPLFAMICGLIVFLRTKPTKPCS